MSYWGGNWDPLNWPSDVSKATMSEIEHAFTYILSLILNGFQVLINSFFMVLESLYSSELNLIVSISESVGPFSLPVFVTLLCGVFCVGTLAFMVLKDLPVVGAFA